MDHLAHHLQKSICIIKKITEKISREKENLTMEYLDS